MAVKHTYSILLLLLIFCIDQVYSSKNGHAVITLQPDFIEFNEKTETPLLISEVQELLSVASGFSYHKELKFHGLYPPGPFDHVEAAAVLTLYGGEKLVGGLAGKSLMTQTDQPNVPVNRIKHRMENLYEDRSLFLDFPIEATVKDLIDDNDMLLKGLSDDMDSIKAEVPKFTSTLVDYSDPDIKALASRCALIHQVLMKVTASKEHSQVTYSDLFSFELSIPEPKDDKTLKQASFLVTGLIQEINRLMEGLYSNKALVLIVSMPSANAAKSRKARSLLAVNDNSNLKRSLNVATFWTADYPAIFQIILWTSVFLFLLILFVTYGMANMDPGTDSIIYRMTTTRLKKD